MLIGSRRGPRNENEAIVFAARHLLEVPTDAPARPNLPVRLRPAVPTGRRQMSAPEPEEPP